MFVRLAGRSPRRGHDNGMEFFGVDVAVVGPVWLAVIAIGVVLRWKAKDR
jgi:hypothetical protein